MRNRPTIGLTTQTLEPQATPGQLLPRCWVMSQRYVRVLAAAGAVPWVIPLLEGDEPTLRAIYEQLDGLFLPGGVDVDPAAYGEARGPHCGPIDPARDWAELRLVRWALDEGKPLLAVCRGAQLLNVAFGGTLYQDVAAQHPGALKHDHFPTDGRRRDDLAHTVRIAAGSRLARLLDAETLSVNSMHHQGIARLAPGLVAVATSADGLVEGVESADGQFVLGVQWHPEDLVDVDPRMRRLFTELISAAAARGAAV
ncbi:MAG TPA: gamma-glutamyl-gamma-aminobutyrate hydrolase family protein [Gemmatimonadales bacterium]|nr:gamma-glutamyl-gamma-aminobutyrate hydrolase family protein [Gemmatimonadales bacterium]